MCDAYLFSRSLWTCPHLFPPLSSFSPSPLSTVVLSVTSLCPYNSLLYAGVIRLL